ncbi:hypothetical protein FDZ73_16585 [bacterium]|nr:MAG: hypothetical protein FDZ73_16585 [bacterium]
MKKYAECWREKGWFDSQPSGGAVTPHTLSPVGEKKDMKDHFRKLKWTIQALALPPEEQLRLFPDFVCKADELALEYHEALAVIKGKFWDQCSPEQKQSLIELDKFLDQMSGEVNALSWTDEALRSSPIWVEVRRLALEALSAFGWPVETPPLEPAERGTIYVSR